MGRGSTQYLSLFHCGQVILIENNDNNLSIIIYILLCTIGLTTGKSIENIVISFFQSGLIQPGGILTTLTDDTGQQWDSPNAWAPLVLMTIEGLIRTLIPVGAFLGVNVAMFFKSRFCAHFNFVCTQKGKHIQSLAQYELHRI